MRDALAALLSRAVDLWLATRRRRRPAGLTPDEAVAVLDAYDDGRLGDDAVRALLPLSAREASIVMTDEGLAAALYRLHLAAGFAKEAARQAALGGLVRVVEGRRYDAMIRVTAGFEERTFAIARRVARGGSVGAWQSAMADEIRSEILSGASAGLGREPLPSEVRTALAREAGYLSRFADEVASRRALAEATGDPSKAFSEKAIRSRAAMYGAEGRAMMQVGIESRRGPGFVAYYVDRDDGGTCPDCRAAGSGGLDGRGVYALGKGPMPGRDCRAKNKCRCRRDVRRDPQAYARLTATVNA